MFRLFAAATVLAACGAAVAGQFQPLYLVNAHTAGIPDRGQYQFESRIFPAGDPAMGTGLTLGFIIGVTNRLTLGLGYGGEGLVGRGRAVRFHQLPWWLVKYRLIEEKIHFPGVAIGYDHLGHGGSADTKQFLYKGNIFKSPGFFCSLSKNYLLFSVFQFGIHGMCSYSMEEFRTIHWPDATAGIDLGLNDELSLMFEYDFALNMLDPRPGRTAYYARPDEGYFNAGIRWSFTPNFSLEFDARDLLERRSFRSGRPVGWERSLKFVYYSEF
jgi:hypothetical protein